MRQRLTLHTERGLRIPQPPFFHVGARALVWGGVRWGAKVRWVHVCGS